MKKLLYYLILSYTVLFLLAYICSNPEISLAQQSSPDYRNNPAYWFSSYNPTPISNTASTAVVTPAPTPTGTPASQRYYITDITVANSSASVDTDVQLLDGSTVRWVGPAAHAEGGYSHPFITPLRGSANGTWNCKDLTTGASVTCSVGGYRAPY